jgi:hypothetical protein
MHFWKVVHKILSSNITLNFIYLPKVPQTNIFKQKEIQSQTTPLVSKTLFFLKSKAKQNKKQANTGMSCADFSKLDNFFQKVTV